jgi:hypothetical protein
MLQAFVSMFHLFSKRMLQVYRDVAYVSHMFASVLFGCCVFLQVFQMHISSVSSAFRRMLQVLRLNVSKVDRVLHFSSPSVGSPRCPILLLAPAGHQPPPPSLLDVGDVQDGKGPHGRAKRRGKMTIGMGIQTPPAVWTYKR